MARITVEDCMKNVENDFSLVILAAKRTRELHNGATPLITGRGNKEVVTALREIAAGRVKGVYASK